MVSGRHIELVFMGVYTPCKAIFCWDIPLHRPEQFLEWPLILLNWVSKKHTPNPPSPQSPKCEQLQCNILWSSSHLVDYNLRTFVFSVDDHPTPETTRDITYSVNGMNHILGAWCDLWTQWPMLPWLDESTINQLGKLSHSSSRIPGHLFGFLRKLSNLPMYATRLIYRTMRKDTHIIYPLVI